MSFESFSFPLKKYIFSFALAFAATLFLQAVLSLVFAFFPPGEKLFSVLCSAFPYFSAFLAAFLCAYRHGKRGFLTGMVSADLYILFLRFCGVLFFKNTLSAAEILSSLAISSLCGIVGGIIGINSK